MKVLRKKDGAEKKPTVGIVHAIAVAIVVTMLVAAVVLGIRQRIDAHGFVIIGDGIRVQTTVAKSVVARNRGLSGKSGLAPDEGMLFIFDAPAVYRFWMKEMRFPIDIIWLANGHIVDITTDLPVPIAGEELPVFSPKVAVDRVLEVPAGFVQAHGLKLDMPVEYHGEGLGE